LLIFLKVILFFINFFINIKNQISKKLSIFLYLKKLSKNTLILCFLKNLSKINTKLSVFFYSILNRMDESNTLYPKILKDNLENIPKVSLTDKCIVLDLDQTLIATQDEMESLQELEILSDPKLISLRNRTYIITIDDLEKPGIGTKLDCWGVTRPHIDEFLMFCFSYFKIVAVWSAGKRKYVEAIVDHIFKDIQQPHIIFTYDDIIFDKRKNPGKPLVNMIEANTILKRYMSLKNTLALDDNPKTFSKNIKNGILLPAYEPALNITALSQDDPTLLQFKSWLLLSEVMHSKDVQLLDKSKIFTTSLKSYKNMLNDQDVNKFK